LPKCTLLYDGKCVLNIVVNIQGTMKNVDVLIDTGFTSGTGFGLKLPLEYARYAKTIGTGSVRVADGRQVNTDSISDAEIIQIDKHQLRNAVTVPAIFMGSSGAIGVLFLQRRSAEFDGA